MRSIATVAAFLLLAHSGAGVPTSRSEPSPAWVAVRDFDSVVVHMRRDYAGWPDKVERTGRRAEVDSLARRTRERIAAAPDSMIPLTRRWLDWFRDQHVGLTDRSPAPDPGAANQGQREAEDRRLAEGGERVELPDGVEPPVRVAGDPLQGTWETLDGTYRVVVQRAAPHRDEWRGVVLASRAPSWSRGQIKFEVSRSDSGLGGTFLLRDHTRRGSRVDQPAGEDLLRFSSLGIVWRRTGTEPGEALDRIVPARRFFLRPLSEHTLWLRLPDFQLEHRVEIESLLVAHEALLRRAPNLLVDLRNNGGGADASYRELLRWICTRPIDSPGVVFRVSPANANAFEALLATRALPRDLAEDVRQLVARMRKTNEEWIGWSDRPPRPRECDAHQPSPRRVGILITRAGSSGEQFVLDARQSDKVTLFGAPTQGVLDYSNQLEAELPSGCCVLRYSSSRSLRLPDHPIDNVGILPDVPVDEAVGDPVAWVQKWLESRPPGPAGRRR